MKECFSYHVKMKKMAGPSRFELENDGVKVRCLTAWLWSYPFFNLHSLLYYNTLNKARYFFLFLNLFENFYLIIIIIITLQ